MTLTIGLLRNRSSTRNRRGGTGAAPGGVMLRETGSLDELSGALADLRAGGVGLLILDGGDGTVREVVTRLPAVWGEAPLRLAILAHGNTNLIARKTGAVRGAEGLARLVGAAQAGRLDERRVPVLSVTREGAPALAGFIAGWGVYAAGTRLASEEIAARGGGQVALAVAAMLRRALIGREAAAIRRGIAADLSADSAALPAGPRLAGLVTTLPGALIMGLQPFWGAGAGGLRWLDVAAPARHLALAAPFVLAGRPMGWMRRAGYRSGRAAVLDLGLDPGARFVLDGEAFDPGPSGRLRFSADRVASFVTPR